MDKDFQGYKLIFKAEVLAFWGHITWHNGHKSSFLCWTITNQLITRNNTMQNTYALFRSEVSCDHENADEIGLDWSMA